MKKQEGEVRTLVFKLRLNQEEKNKLKELQQNSTERDLSAYIRKVSLRQPVIVRYRNETANEFLLCMLQLKNELNAIGNNFNQAVKKLHMLEKIPEFRFWLQQQSELEQSMIGKTEEIKRLMHQLHQQWSQK